MKTKHIKLLVIFAAVAVAGIFAFQKAKTSEASDELIIEEADSGGGAETESVPQEAVSPAQYSAYICGEVKNPGVYTVQSGERISRLLELAGGATEDADLTSVNLAREVSDGEQIIIASTKAGTAASNVPSAASGEATGLININLADKAALMSLPGIGEVRAQAIISYREKNGSFKKIEDIKKVSGIKDGSFEKIKDLITV